MRAKGRLRIAGMTEAGMSAARPPLPQARSGQMVAAGRPSRLPESMLYHLVYNDGLVGPDVELTERPKRGDRIETKIGPMIVFKVVDGADGIPVINASTIDQVPPGGWGD